MAFTLRLHGGRAFEGRLVVRQSTDGAMVGPPFGYPIGVPTDRGIAAILPASRLTVWTAEAMSARFTSRLRRERSDRQSRVDFDCSRRVPVPPALWGTIVSGEARTADAEVFSRRGYRPPYSLGGSVWRYAQRARNSTVVIRPVIFASMGGRSAEPSGRLPERRVAMKLASV